MRALFASMILVLAASPLPARMMVVFRLASPPLPVEDGRQFSVCAANVGTVKADLTLQFISVRTGAIVATRDVTLPPPGAAATRPDPCLNTSPEQIGMGGSEPPLAVALVIVRHGLFSRASAVTASVQVTATAPSGERRIVASIPLHLATMVHGRNTPIESVQ